MSDIDNLGSYYQEPNSIGFNSMGSLDNRGAADRAVQREVSGCASHQGGTTSENRMSELHQDAPGQLEAPDLVECEYRDDMYPTHGEWERRQWKESDNTGGDGVPPPEMPIYIMPAKPKPRKLY